MRGRDDRCKNRPNTRRVRTETEDVFEEEKESGPVGKVLSRISQGCPLRGTRGRTPDFLLTEDPRRNDVTEPVWRRSHK